MYKRALSLLLSLGLGCGVFFTAPASFVAAEESASSSSSETEEGSSEGTSEAATESATEAAEESGESEAGTEPVAGEFSEADSQENQYTYHDYSTATPLNWNPHTWEMSDEGSMIDLLSDSFVTAVATDDENTSFEFQFSMAEAYDDVTKDFEEKEKYGIKDGEEGRVWRIKLRNDLKFQDGTPIDANTFEESLKLLLDPARKNYRSNSFRQADYELVNANAYFENDKAGQDRYAAVAKGEDDKYVEGDGTLYVNLKENTTFFGGPAKKYYESEDTKANFTVNGKDLYEAYGDYTELTDEIKEELTQLAKNFGDDSEEAYKEFCFYKDGKYEEMSWDNVGFHKVDDLTFDLIFVNPFSKFYAFTAVDPTGILVKPELYTSLEEKKGDLLATTYGTDLNSSIAYGPYKMTYFEKDKQVIFERNENWWGYKSDQFKDQYQMTRYVIDIVPEYNTRKQLFLQGKLDSLSLQNEDMAQYGQSDRLYKTPQTYTFRFIFASDLNSLKALEQEAGEGNKRILHYDSFRKGISLAMDRQRFCSEATPGYIPNFGLLSPQMYYDIEHDPDSSYRNSDAAKAAICELYGMEYGEGKQFATLEEAYEAINGYDVEEAKKAFTEAYEQAKADGNYTDGQKIEIRVMTGPNASLAPDLTRQNEMMNEFLRDATVGTPLEGLVSMTYMGGDPDRYKSVAEGRVEAITGAWGGAAFYALRNMSVYVSPKYQGDLAGIHESNGWDPRKVDLELTYDFDGDGKEETMTKNLEDWLWYELDINEPVYKNTAARLYIVSQLEKTVLEGYHAVPYGTYVTASLLSKKVEYKYQNYNIMTGYGGTRFITFNYDDKGWVEYVKSQGGSLNYE